MFNRIFCKRRRLEVSVFIVFTLCLSLAATGCEPLRKKFTRQKKKQIETTEAPILEPIEYPKKEYSTHDVYKNHYSLFKAWYGELINSMWQRGNLKRELYLLNQATVNLMKMKELLAEESQKPLEGYLAELKAIASDMQAVVPTRDVSSLPIDLRSLERKVLKYCSFENMKDSIKTGTP